MSQRAGVPTARDVAERAGVSSAAVSYVLSGRRGGKDRISDETRQRVLTAVAELGYVPNQVARSLRRQQTESICLVLPRLGPPALEVLVERLQDAAEQNGYSMIITIVGSAEQEARAIDQLRRGMADGVVFRPGFHEGTDITALERLAESGVAVVVLSDFLESSVFDVFRTTTPEGHQEAVRYLVDQGHRRIGYVGRLPEKYGYRLLRIHQQALHDHGIELDEGLVRGGALNEVQAYRSTRELLNLDQRPSAILVASDRGAIGALWAASDARLRVPEDVAIIGLGNMPEGAISCPPLTTVGPDPLEFSPVFEMLFSRLAGTAPAQGRVFTQKWGLIRRGSA